MVSLRLDIRGSENICGRTSQSNLNLPLVDLLILFSLNSLILNY